MRLTTLALAALLPLAACAATATEIRRAEEASYQAPPATLFVGVVEALGTEHYQVRVVDLDGGELDTQVKVFSATGDLESGGADNIVQVSNGSIALTFHVHLALTGETGRYRIAIEPTIQRIVTGRPNVDVLRLDDPSLPGWVHGRLDHLEVAIYEQLAPYASHDVIAHR